MLSPHVVNRLAAYAEQQLDASKIAAVERHLAVCSRCRDALAEIRRGIALASELEQVPMPQDVAERMRDEIVNGAPPVATHSRAIVTWQRVAAAMLLAAIAVAVYWQVNRPWAELRTAAASPTTFEREGRQLHDLLWRGQMQAGHRPSDEGDAWRWLASQRAPVTGLRPNRREDDKTRFVPVGAAVRTLAGARTSVVAYRIDDKPVTLMLAYQRDIADAPSPGLWSKRVIHRRDANGVNTLTWTVGGGTYVLVSELEGYGQRACFICHTDERFQAPIASLHAP